MKKKKKLIAMVLMSFSLFLWGCGETSKMKDGYYTAEMDGFSHGWKEYVCILVKNDTIISAEFNAKDESGFIKAWDNEYMRNMESRQGTYPNKYTREYVSQLIEEQEDTEVELLTGATSSGGNFVKLIEAVIKQAKSGNAATIIVAGEVE